MIVGYCRVSSASQGADGYGLEAQETAITKACEARGWEAPGFVREVASGASDDRPLLASAVEAVEAQGGTLIVARLDRLSRSVGHFAGLLDRSLARGWDLVTLDPSVDTSTPYGRAMAGMAAVFAQLERELISQRTREGLAQARANGVRMGPPSKMSVEQERTMRDLASLGMSHSEIAKMIGVHRTSVLRGLRRERNARG